MNRIVLSLLLFALAGSLRGQEQMEALEVLPHSGDDFVLSPAQPIAERPIVIDRTSRADILVSALSSSLEVTLISPKHARYQVGQTRPDFESFITEVDAVGANYRAILKDPEAGTWTLQVKGKALSADVVVVVNVFLANQVFVSLVAGDVEYKTGDLAAISLAAFDGAARIRGVQVAGTVQPPTGPASAVTYRDDGQEADFTAGDGIYTALVSLPVVGEYELKADIRGAASTGAFQRTASTRVTARRIAATLGESFHDQGVDDDADGLFDAIVISPAVTVNEGARYRCSVRLRAANGKILQSSSEAGLSQGSASPQVRFDAEEVRAGLGADGAYNVELILIERWDGEDLVFVDRRMELGLTNSYRLTSLQHERVRLTGIASALPVDTNNNGLFDQLRLEIAIESEVSGAFAYSMSLINSHANDLGQKTANFTMAKGINRIRVDFAGAPIGKALIDGPYSLGVMLWGPSSSLFAEARFNTAPYRAAQFERFAADTKAPDLAVKINPDVLTPPNHQMVEVFPTFEVADDRDPAPTVRLTSIVVSEGPNVLGDGNTSPDVRIEGERIFLRAERSGLGEDRLYTLMFSARDASGNVGVASATVRVPHDNR